MPDRTPQDSVEQLPVKVPADAAFEDLVRAYERLWQIANPSNVGNVIFAVEDERHDLVFRLVDHFDYKAPGVLFTTSLSARQIKQEPRQAADQQARSLIETLELMGWREPGSAPPRPPEPGRIEAARRIADKAQITDPADWPGWSTSEQIVAALAADRPDVLPASWADPAEAWTRIDDDQRTAVREANPDMARFCADHADVDAPSEDR